MAFYDSTTEKAPMSPIQKALLLQPHSVLQHQDLLTKISKMANFTDEKAEETLDTLIKQISEQLVYNNPANSHTALLIMDYCVRNGNLFGQYVFGRYILQKLHTICSRDLTKVSANHQQHQQFQYTLIGTILEWHQRFGNVPGSTLNYTFSRLQQSGILALYQSYQQTQNLLKPIGPNNAISHGGNQSMGTIPDLPPSPGPPDEKQRDRAMTTNVQSQNTMQSMDSRNRSQSANAVKQLNGLKVNADALIHRDGRVKLEYTEKFQNEINELISRYLKPSREILSRPKVSLADKKLQSTLRILQTIQQRLVKVISEVKNDDSIVNLAIKANDSIVATVQWFNDLVKQSKMKRKGTFNADKSRIVKQEVLENVDLVALEQQLLIDGAALFKRKQMRELKLQKERQKELEQRTAAKGDDSKDSTKELLVSPQNEPVAVVGVVDHDAVQVDLVSGDAEVIEAQPAPGPEEKSAVVANGSGDSAKFNAAVDAFVVSEPVEPVESVKPVEPVAAAAVLEKEMYENVAAVEAEPVGKGDVVDLLNMETMDDGGKIEDEKEDVVVVQDEVALQNGDDHESDNEVVSAMESGVTVQGKKT